MWDEVRKLIRDEEGPTAIEYAMMIAGIACAIAATIWILGKGTKNSFTTTSTHLP